MEIPDKVQLGFITYNIIRVDNSLNGDRIGEIDYHNAEIKIDNNTAEDMQKWTFYHELVHAMLLKMGYKGEDEVVLDERFIDAFAVVLGELVEGLVEDG